MQNQWLWERKKKSLTTCWLSKCWFSRVNVTYFPPHLPPGAHSVDGRWAWVHICRPRRLHEWIYSLLLGGLARVLSSTLKSCSSSAFNVSDQWCPRWWLNSHFLTTWFYSKQNGISHSCPAECKIQFLHHIKQPTSPSHSHSKSHHFLAECRKLLPWARGATSTVSSFPKKYAVTVLKKHVLLGEDSSILFNSFNQCLLMINVRHH